MPKLTVILITRNEEANLERCLSSLGKPDEIIIVDSGSTDKTPDIAARFGAKFFREEWKGYTAQKNSALDKAGGDWVLSLDADEELPGVTLGKIEQIVRADGQQICGYFFRRKVFYLGQWITHGDWYPDEVLRLWRRGAGRFEGGRVHESVGVRGNTARLSEEILHYSYKDLDDQRRRMETYARLWASDRLAEGRRAGALDHFRPIWRFLRGYILRRGFLDGRRGALIAYFCAKETALKYRYLREMQHA